LENSEREDLDKNSKPEVPAGVIAIAVVMVFTGVGYVAQGVAFIFGVLDPAILLSSLLYFSLWVGGGIIMILIGRSLVHLKWWGLWGAMAMLVATILLVLINPFASFQIWDDPVGRISGAAVFFLIFCYLGMPAVRSKFSRPDAVPTLGWRNKL
jgi:hypothetical protein